MTAPPPAVRSALTLVRTAQQQRLLTSSKPEPEQRRSARICPLVFGHLRLCAYRGCRSSRAYAGSGSATLGRGNPWGQ
jgi:hypothetical protein